MQNPTVLQIRQSCQSLTHDIDPYGQMAKLMQLAIQIRNFKAQNGTHVTEQILLEVTSMLRKCQAPPKTAAEIVTKNIAALEDNDLSAIFVVLLEAIGNRLPKSDATEEADLSILHRFAPEKTAQDLERALTVPKQVESQQIADLKMKITSAVTAVGLRCHTVFIMSDGALFRVLLGKTVVADRLPLTFQPDRVLFATRRTETRGVMPSIMSPLQEEPVGADIRNHLSDTEIDVHTVFVTAGTQLYELVVTGLSTPEQLSSFTEMKIPELKTSCLVSQNVILQMRLNTQEPNDDFPSDCTSNDMYASHKCPYFTISAAVLYEASLYISGPNRIVVLRNSSLSHVAGQPIQTQQCPINLAKAAPHSPITSGRDLSVHNVDSELPIKTKHGLLPSQFYAGSVRSPQVQKPRNFNNERFGDKNGSDAEFCDVIKMFISQAQSDYKNFETVRQTREIWNNEFVTTTPEQLSYDVSEHLIAIEGKQTQIRQVNLQQSFTSTIDQIPGQIGSYNISHHHAVEKIIAVTLFNNCICCVRKCVAGTLSIQLFDRSTALSFPIETMFDQQVIQIEQFAQQLIVIGDGGEIRVVTIGDNEVRSSNYVASPLGRKKAKTDVVSGTMGLSLQDFQ